jgi:hypothetical protein
MMRNEYSPIHTNFDEISPPNPEYHVTRRKLARKLACLGMAAFMVGFGVSFLSGIRLHVASSSLEGINNELTLDAYIGNVSDMNVKPKFSRTSESASVLDTAVRASFPKDCSFFHYTLSADDEGLAYVSSNGRSFRSDHTNLFGRGITGKIVSVDANAFLIRSNGECCRFMDSGDEILLKPTSFFNYRSIGNANFDTTLATLW